MSLSSYILENLELVKPNDEFLSVLAETALYLVQVNTAFEYQNAIRDICHKMSPKLFRLGLIRNAYFLLNVKLFVLHLAKTRGATKADARAYAKEFGISKDDQKYLFKLYEQVPWFGKELRKVTKTVEWDHLNLTEIKADFDDVFPSVIKYVRSKVYKKLAFISRSTNTDFKDLVQDVMVKVLHSYYKLVPTNKTLLYITNYLKRSANNHIVNIIKAETTKKRGRLVNVGDNKNNEPQFNLLCVSENQARKVVDDDGNELSLTSDSEDESNSFAKFEVMFSIDELLKSVRVGSKKHRFLLIILGFEDREFTEFLRERKIAKPTEDNSDVQERTSVSEFNELIAEHLSVKVLKLTDYLNKVKTQLAA